MKKYSILLFLFLSGFVCYGQGVGIGTSSPDPSAALQVSSKSQGLLVPRMTAAQRNGITDPAAGLMVFQTDGTTGYYTYNATGWTGVTGSSLNGQGASATYGWMSTVFGDGPNTVGVGAQVGEAIQQGLTCDRSGNFYVPNRYGEICKVNACGTLTALAGKINDPNNAFVADTDGVGSAATIVSPADVATDLAGNVYFTEFEVGTIRKVTPSGVVTTIAGQARHAGYVDGPVATAEFNDPISLTVDPAGNIYVADYLNNRIRKIGTDGMVSTLAGNGQYKSVDGVGTAASFYTMTDIQCDINGNVYVADQNYIRKITPGGVVTTVAKVPNFFGVGFLTVDKDGNIYYDDGKELLGKVSADGGVTTLIGQNATDPGSIDIDGPPSQALLSYPKQLTIGPGGNLYMLTGFGLKKILLH